MSDDTTEDLFAAYANPRCQWDKVDDVIKLGVLSYLSRAERGHAARVCKDWNRVLSDRCFWRVISNTHYTPEYLDDTTVTNLLALHGKHVTYFDFRAPRLPLTSLSRVGVSALATYSPNLKVVNLSGVAMLPVDCLVDVLTAAPRITHLYLSSIVSSEDSSHSPVATFFREDGIVNYTSMCSYSHPALLTSKDTVPVISFEGFGPESPPETAEMADAFWSYPLPLVEAILNSAHLTTLQWKFPTWHALQMLLSSPKEGVPLESLAVQAVFRLPSQSSSSLSWKSLGVGQSPETIDPAPGVMTSLTELLAPVGFVRLEDLPAIWSMSGLKRLALGPILHTIPLTDLGRRAFRDPYELFNQADELVEAMVPMVHLPCLTALRLTGWYIVRPMLPSSITRLDLHRCFIPGEAFVENMALLASSLVSLNLHYSTVPAKALVAIANAVHLTSLDLSFTSVTCGVLKEVTPALPSLSSLNIANSPSSIDDWAHEVVTGVIAAPPLSFLNLTKRDRTPAMDDLATFLRESSPVRPANVNVHLPSYSYHAF